MTERPDTPDDVDMPATSAADAGDIPDTMPPAGGGDVEVDDTPLGVEQGDESAPLPGVPDVGEGASDG